LRGARNRTISLDESEARRYAGKAAGITGAVGVGGIENRIVNQAILDVVDFLPPGFADLLILDPPYNLNKTFKSTAFRKKSIGEYAEWFERQLVCLLGKLKETATVYVCSDWRSSTAVHLVLEKFLKVRNRITWEREKGRGAKANWKNASEDIWFATVSDEYTFNVEDVKLKRRVIAPYTDDNGAPKGWERTDNGRFRLTYPSNLWNDITVPFWSMRENTEHPAQKSEKLVAKLILASTNEHDLVFDPFMGVGSSVVAARKLNRRFFGVEVEREYCLLAAKRLELAEFDRTIQGYDEGVFRERNTPGVQRRSHSRSEAGKLSGSRR